MNKKHLDINSLEPFNLETAKKNLRGIDCDTARSIILEKTPTDEEAAKMIEHLRSCEPCGLYFIKIREDLRNDNLDHPTNES